MEKLTVTEFCKNSLTGRKIGGKRETFERKVFVTSPSFKKEVKLLL